MESEWTLGATDVKDHASVSPGSISGSSPEPEAIKSIESPVEKPVEKFRRVGPFKLRPVQDDLPQKWWFASTGIPLIAATIGPLSNVLSIAALVTPWRDILPNDGQLPDGTDDAGTGIADPEWELILNAISLACGFIGNFFLLCNFTNRIRYIVALPMTILFWFLSSGILIGLTVAVHVHIPPIAPGETYSQGFWHAVLAAILYSMGSIMLMANLVGYLSGYYPQRFELDHDQSTLIMQTMMFFFWLAAGAGAFCSLEGLHFADALYYCDVSVLTIGFGDFYPETNGGRGFLFVFEVLGIIQLGLVISAISRFVATISADKVMKTHQRRMREVTVGRTVTNEEELRERLGLPPPKRRRSSTASADGQSVAGESMATTGTSLTKMRTPLERERSRQASIAEFGQIKVNGRVVTFHEKKEKTAAGRGGAGRRPSNAGSKSSPSLNRDAKMQGKKSKAEKRHHHHKTLLLLQEEKDRFDAMRDIQSAMKRYKQYWSLVSSLVAFGMLWCLGALVFLYTEERILGLTYFEQLYFCFVSLLTIGYGDFSPKSNIGKPFFIVWSLIAVPTMTILVNELSGTVVSTINHWHFTVADLALSNQKGLMSKIMQKNPGLKEWLTNVFNKRAADKRVKNGFQLQDPDIAEMANLDGQLRAMHNAKDEDADLLSLVRSPTFNLGVASDLEQQLQQQNNKKKPNKNSNSKLNLKKSSSNTSNTNNITEKPPPTSTTMTTTPALVDGGDSEPEMDSDNDTEHDLARHLALNIRKVAKDLVADRHKRYPYEQWVRFTKLIRFSSADHTRRRSEMEAVEEQRGLVEWDWLGEDSPMLADVTEAEWVLDRLCESLSRYTRRQTKAVSTQWTTRRRTPYVRDDIDLPPEITEAEDEEAHARAHAREMEEKEEMLEMRGPSSTTNSSSILRRRGNDDDEEYEIRSIPGR